jgi:phytoene synthase
LEVDPGWGNGMSRDACAAMVARGDPDRFAATMAAPVAARVHLWPFYAFNLEVARAPWVTAEPLIAQMRLQFWADILDDSQTDNTPVAHEIAGPLVDVIRANNVPLAPLHAMVAARHWDIERSAFSDRAAFDAHLDATTAGLMWAGACALGLKPVLWPQAESVIRDVGYAMGLANWLRAVPALEAAGTFPLVDGRPTAIAELAQDGLARLARARSARNAVPKVALPALLPAWQAGALLSQAAASPQRVADGALGQSEFARRTGLMWCSLTGRW